MLPLWNLKQRLFNLVTHVYVSSPFDKLWQQMPLWQNFDGTLEIYLIIFILSEASGRIDEYVEAAQRGYVKLISNPGD